MIKNFSQYLIEEQREVFFTFGRMNPPTIGHGKVMDVLASKSGKADYKVYVSQTQDKKKNPLSYNDKVKHARKMFPKHARNIISDKKVKTAIDALVVLYDQGYKNVTMVVGSDRVMEFDVLLNKYNGQKARHGFYNFQSIKVVSAGERDPDADGVEGMSASKQRENASKNDFVTFSQGVPKAMSNSDARKLFNDVRTGMGLKEEKEFKNHISLQPVSETREKFVQGKLFQVGDEVVIKESEEVGTVSVLGANYVIVETASGKKVRKWLDSVEKLEYTTDMNESLKKSIASVASKFPENSKAKYKGKTVDVLGNGKDYVKIAIGNRTLEVSPSELKSVKEEFSHTGIITFRDMMEEGGAGEEGTNKLRNKYAKETPGQEDLVIEGLGKDIAKLLSKTLKKGQYDKVASYIKKEIEAGRLDLKRHNKEYIASKIIRKFNLSGIDAHALADKL